MKGVILAGGTGSRLRPLTSVLNKHLVAVGEVPMIEYPLATLRRLGVKDITIVSGAEHVGTVLQYLTVEHPEIDFTYKVQKKAGGIAQALALTENVVNGDPLAVILGDNIYEDNFSSAARRFEQHPDGTMLFLKSVPDPERFGVAVVEGGRVTHLVEKPKEKISNLAVTGLYFYGSDVFEMIRCLKPSRRGELEITELNDIYVRQGRASLEMLSGFWSDAGTPESRRRAEDYIYKIGKNKFLDV